MGMLRAILVFFRGILTCRAALAAENLALRQQLAALRQSVKRPRLRPRDRVFWVWLSRLWRGWRSGLVRGHAWLSADHRRHHLVRRRTIQSLLNHWPFRRRIRFSRGTPVGPAPARRAGRSNKKSCSSAELPAANDDTATGSWERGQHRL